jgi:uncharacterized protein (TIGR00730 family)
MVERVCVFCGSRNGLAPLHRRQAERLGRLIGEAGLALIYGGGDIGLMGACADAAVTAGGRVHGYIPERLLQREVGHRGITELVLTKDMFERKAKMIAAADAFIVIAGGLGTLDEFFEVLTLRQLGYHDKPIVLVAEGGYWEPLGALLAHVVEAGFADRSIETLYEVVASVDGAIDVLGATAPATAAQ